VILEREFRLALITDIIDSDCTHSFYLEVQEQPQLTTAQRSPPHGLLHNQRAEVSVDSRERSQTRSCHSYHRLRLHSLTQSRASRAAPADNSTEITSTWPPSHAICRGVLLYYRQFSFFSGHAHRGSPSFPKLDFSAVHTDGFRRLLFLCLPSLSADLQF
jgi:hypothetical protein